MPLYPNMQINHIEALIVPILCSYTHSCLFYLLTSQYYKVQPSYYVKF